MNILQKIFKNVGKKFSTISDIRIQRHPFETGKVTGVSQTTHNPLHGYAGWAAWAISKKFEALSSIEFKHYQMNSKGEIEETLKSDILALLYKPNDRMTKGKFFSHLSLFLDVWGRCPIFIDRLKGGKVMNIFPVRPDLLKAIYQNNTLIKYEFRVGSTIETFKPEEIIDIYIPSATDMTKAGISPLQKAGVEVDIDLTAALWNLGLLQNKAEPDGVIETDQGLDDETFKRLQENWFSRYSKPGKVAILERGLKWKKTENNQKEMGYHETRKDARDAILTLLDVPKGLYLADNVNLSNAESAYRAFLTLTIEPRMKFLEEHLNEFLMPLFDMDGWLEHIPPVSDDREKTVDELYKLTNIVYTVNESRERQNLAPIEGGDVLYMPSAGAVDDGEKKLATKAITKTGYIKNASSIRSKILARKRKTIVLEEIRRDIAQKVLEKLVPAKKTIYKIAPQKKEFSKKMVAERKKFLEIAEKKEKKLKKQLQEFFTEQKKLVLEQIKAEKGFKSIRIEEQQVGVLIRLLELSYIENMQEGMTAIALLLGSEAVDIFQEDPVKEFLLNVPQKFAEKIQETTYKSLQETLAQGVDAGESIEELKNRVSTIFTEASESRAEAIARTEVGRAQNFGRYEEMKALGVEERVWMAVFRNTRDSHRRLDGTTVGIDEKFNVGGYKAYCPNDSSLPAHETVNCQCSVAPVV